MKRGILHHGIAPAWNAISNPPFIVEHVFRCLRLCGHIVGVSLRHPPPARSQARDDCESIPPLSRHFPHVHTILHVLLFGFFCYNLRLETVISSCWQMYIFIRRCPSYQPFTNRRIVAASYFILWSQLLRFALRESAWHLMPISPPPWL